VPTDVIMPALGVAQDTGRVVRWLSAEGELVSKGEPLIEIETDKVTVELDAPADGTLAAVTSHAGDDAPVGSVIAVILAAGEALPALPRDAPGPVVTASPRAPGPEVPLDAPAPRRAPASPVARRMARERGIDLVALAARLGRPVQAGDVQAALTTADEVAQPVLADSVLAVSNAWRTMSERTAATWTTTPHFALQREVNASRLLSWQLIARKRSGVRVTITDLLVRAVADALVRHPAVNRSWAQGGLIQHASIGIGLAVAVDDGLVVPVIHDADTLNVAEIAARRSAIVTRAHEGRLEPGDVHGGTFTISNLGMYDVDAFTAIINSPQAAIVAIGRIVDRVLPVGGIPVVQPAMTVTLSCDHRALDGARAGLFLQTLAETLEEPAGLIG
jgi:pyruvate dehydrogenase E2 component (dihydrolipoamide acetyltransferase)